MTAFGTTPPPASPAGAPTRLLRRSRTDRIGAGVAGGLGQYFSVDPVLFRVLFATAAFFGGAGVLAYLLAWAAIPEEGTAHAPVDGWVSKLRQRRVPFWLIVAAAALLLWLAAFSWWAPGPFFPVVAVVIVLVVVFGRHGRRSAGAPADDATAPLSSGAGPSSVSLSKDDPAASAAAGPTWMRETRQWVSESRQASRERARRAFPVKIATLLTLVAALVTLGLIDASTGIWLPTYFWFALGIVGAGLLVGMVLRRTPWSMMPLFVLAAAGTIAFAGSHARLHDGVGQRDWTPTTSLSSTYDLAVGQATLDLRSLKDVSARSIRMDVAAGDVRILAPKTMNLTVHANVHFGIVTLDNEGPDHGNGGVSVSRLIEPLSVATGPAITIDVHLATGRIEVFRS